MKWHEAATCSVRRDERRLVFLSSSPFIFIFILHRSFRVIIRAQALQTSCSGLSLFFPRLDVSHRQRFVELDVHSNKLCLRINILLMTETEKIIYDKSRPHRLGLFVWSRSRGLKTSRDVAGENEEPGGSSSKKLRSSKGYRDVRHNTKLKL